MTFKTNWEAGEVGHTALHNAIGTRLNHGDSVILVAANNASDKEKALADYLCDGTNDEVQIQAAIDAANALPNGGRVQLSTGDFSLSVNASSPSRITGTGNLTASVTSGDPFTLSVPDASLFSVGDCLLVSGGDDGSGNSMEELYLEQPATVVGVDAGTDIISLAGYIATSFTGVTWTRLRWSLHLKPSVELLGYGIGVTGLSLADTQDCVMVYVDRTDATVEAQVLNGRIADMSFSGRKANQTALRVGEAHGIVQSSRVKDFHIDHIAMWFCNGHGVVSLNGWGFQWFGGGWSEYNEWAGLFLGRYGGVGRVIGVKLTWNVGPGVTVAAPISNIANCHLGSDQSCAIQLRSGADDVIISNNDGGTMNTDSGFIGVVGTVRKPTITGNSFIASATNPAMKFYGSSIITDGQISGNNWGQAHAAPIAGWNYASGMWANITDNIGLDRSNGALEFLEAWNATGSNILAGRAVASVHQAVATKQRVQYATNSANIRGVSVGSTSANNTAARVVTNGLASALATSASVFSIGDSITVSADDGKIQQATSGDWVFAVAREAKIAGSEATVAIEVLGYVFQAA